MKQLFPSYLSKGLFVLSAFCATTWGGTAEDLANSFKDYFKEEASWNSDENRPERINSENTYLIPAKKDDPTSKEVFISLHTSADTMKGYADGKPRTKEQAEAILARHINSWDQLRGAFCIFTKRRILL